MLEAGSLLELAALLAQRWPLSFQGKVAEMSFSVGKRLGTTSAWEMGAVTAVWCCPKHNHGIWQQQQQQQVVAVVV